MATKENQFRSFQVPQNYMNLFAGIAVVAVIALGIAGLIRSKALKTPGTDVHKTPAEELQMANNQNNLPAKYTVVQGDDLWKISEKFYNTGYNWSEIAKANNIANPNDIKADMEITIPKIEKQQAETVVQQESITMEVPTVTAVPTQAQEMAQSPPQQTPSAINSNSYTVVKGDNLWNIAVRAYGDGFRWVDIAKANKLVHPNLIHAGNVFVLPR